MIKNTVRDEVNAGTAPAAHRGELGQGIAEYVIILAVIVVAGIVLVTAFSGQLTGVWNSVTTQFGSLA